jgi:hypothetical protein
MENILPTILRLQCDLIVHVDIGPKECPTSQLLELLFLVEKDIENSLLYGDKSLMLRFLFHVYFAPEKNSSPRASSSACMVVLLML